ncbi:MAG TPA: thiolase family protein [Parachlamydiaceae bacterium]|nr:thiolase family protein [Parachlamydiaceae bacterium]
MKERIAIVAGIRSPFCKGGGVMRDMAADDIGAYVVAELMAKSNVDPSKVDELIFGNVIQPSQSANIARIISIKAGLPVKIPAYTVNRNCASGLEAITSGADKILLGHNDIVVAGGTESMSNFPVEISKSFKDFLMRLTKAKSFGDKLAIACSFRPSFLVPEMPELSDPLCDLNMGQTAEVLAREFKVTRQEQDQFALNSQNRAEKAMNEGRLGEEIEPIPIGPKYTTVQAQDEGPRANQTLEALAKLKPAFDKLTGTVTAGNSSQITDGAAAVLLMKESKAKELGLEPLGYIRDYAAAGLQPNRMGLGPAFAISKVLTKTGLNLSDIDLIEINEAFAAQVLACVRALSSDDFAKNELGRDKAVGIIDLEKLNVNGGAIALGHPLGASGARLVVTLLKELRRRNKNTGIASLCIGGGQGQAIVLEVK